MQQLNVIPQKCTGCVQCELACSFVKTGAFQPSRSLVRVKIFDELAFYSPYTCFQCAEAWCMTPCPVSAVTIHPDTGAKVVQADTCVGCGLCAIACPFGTMFFNPDTQKAHKCDLCDGDPACAKACPTGAIQFVEVDGAPWIGPWSAQVDDAYRDMLTGRN